MCVPVPTVASAGLNVISTVVGHRQPHYWLLTIVWINLWHRFGSADELSGNLDSSKVSSGANSLTSCWLHKFLAILTGTRLIGNKKFTCMYISSVVHILLEYIIYNIIINKFGRLVSNFSLVCEISPNWQNMNFLHCTYFWVSSQITEVLYYKT